MKQLRANLQRVEERIERACARAGRRRADVTLVAVTKYVSTEVAAELIELGVRDLGESRPQELWRKAAAVPQARWHLVGHLQRNKVERTLPLAELIHSIDSVRLLEEVQAEAAKHRRTSRLLLEVNASGEAAKHGFPPEELPALVRRLWPFSPHLEVLGLMTMAAATDDAERARPSFRLLRDLRDRIRSMLGDAAALPHLSMGMTGDFEAAVEEGATLVRIGSALFEGLSS